MVRLIMWTLLAALVAFFVINGWYLRKDIKDHTGDPFKDETGGGDGGKVKQER
ncbi:MAG: hypothetical protein HZB29_09255 [Nitrospinae bacterium]|nr:hypothetical protein [Nitrospinota bacterium]